MKQSKAVKESVKVLTVRFCPYCRSSRVSSSMGTCFCLDCGASFVAARVDRQEQFPNNERAQTRMFRSHAPPILFAPSTKTFPSGLSEFSKTLDSLGLSDVVREEAVAIYEKASAREMAHGRNLSKGMAPASVYAACKQAGLSVSFKEVARAFGVDKKEAERSYTYLLNEMGYFSSLLSPRATVDMIEPEVRHELKSPIVGTGDLEEPDVKKFVEKKGTYEFLRLLKEKPRRWKTLEKELALSPRTLSERISQALELEFIEKVRRLKIGATYYRLTKRGTDVFDAMTGSTTIY
jgi:DNA-binding HxlR family transcriptional regulator